MNNDKELDHLIMIVQHGQVPSDYRGVINHAISYIEDITKNLFPQKNDMLNRKNILGYLLENISKRNDFGAYKYIRSMPDHFSVCDLDAISELHKEKYVLLSDSRKTVKYTSAGLASILHETRRVMAADACNVRPPTREELEFDGHSGKTSIHLVRRTQPPLPPPTLTKT